jgi:tyrosine-protein kinase Etk/Wzc
MTNTHLANNQQPTSYQASAEEDEIDLGELFATVVDGKYVIILMTLLFLALGVAKALIDTPIYKADALLQIEDKTSALDALGSLTNLMDTKTPALAEIEIIKSRLVLGSTVKNLNLDIIAQAKYFPIIGKAIARRFQQHNKAAEVATSMMGLDSYAWGGEVIHIDSFIVPKDWADQPLILIAGEQGHFSLWDDDELLVEGVVGKTIIRPMAESLQKFNLLVSLLKARPGTQFIITKQSLTNSIDHLNDNLIVTEKGKLTGILSATLEDADPVLAAQTLNEVAKIYVKQNIEQKSKESQSTLEFLDKQLPLIKDQLEAATSALNDFRGHKGSINLDIETEAVLAGVVDVNTQLTVLQQKRDELRGRFTESHPVIIATDKQITRLKEQLKAINKKIELLPETQRVIVRLSSDVQVSTELYTTMLNNAQTLRVAKSGTIGNVRIIDEAVLSLKPIKPKKSLIVMVSFILGLMLGIAWVFIRKALHTGIEDPDQIEKKLNIPVYATIPHSNEQAKLSAKLSKGIQPNVDLPFILALTHKEDLAIESLRSLRTTLHFAFLEAHNNIIMITGPSPGIGKTFVAINLAVVLANAGKKILLIDADLRKGLTHQSLGLDREDGLSDLISNRISLKIAVRHIAAANIDFISTGSIPPNPSELLLHEHFELLLENLAKQYDHIIIDSPPILAVTDAGIIGRIASATLMVVKAGQHPLRELEQCTKRLAQSGVTLKGIVFNDLPENSSRYGTSYGYGKYVYRYNYQKAN